MSTSQDDVRAALESVTTKEGAAPLVEPKSEVLPPVQADPTPGAPQRGADGRFQPTQKAEAPPSQPLGTEPTPKPQAPAPKAPAAPAAPQSGVALDHSKPPSAWTPGMKAKWDGIPEDVRQEITRREEASARGVAQLKAHYEPMESVYKTVAQYGDYFQALERDPEGYLNEMIQIEQTLTLGNPAQKMQTMLDLADRYEIPLRKALDDAMGGKLDAFLQQSHRAYKTPAQTPPEVQQELMALRQQQQAFVDAVAEDDLDEFLQDPEAHPYFEQVQEQMADLLEQGLVESYEDAYQLAVWRNPQLRASAQAALQPAAQQLNGIQHRQAMAARIATPSSAPIIIPGQATPDETTEDTVRRAWNAAANPGAV